MAAPTQPDTVSSPSDETPPIADGTATSAGSASPVVETATEYVAISRGKLVRRRFLRNKLAVTGVGILVLLYVIAFVGPYLIPWDYTTIDYTALLTPPSAEHWFGTSQIGQDVLAQTLRGLQKSLTIGLLVAIGSTFIAAVVGSAAGYFGGWTDRTLMWIVDLLLVVPSFLIIAIASPALQGKSWLFLVLLLAAFQWLLTSRIVRGLTLSLKEREFVQAARYMGTSPWKIISSHILPNMASLLIIDATITVGSAIIAETGLSFFGFGVQPPDVSLGTLIADGTASALTSPWKIISSHILPNMASLLIIDATITVGSAIIAETGLSFFGFGVQPPDVSLGTLIADGTASALTFPWLFAFSLGFLVLTVLAANFAGDGLRDALDPNSQKGRAK